MKKKKKKEIEERFFKFDVNFRLIRDIRDGVAIFKFKINSAFSNNTEVVVQDEGDLYVCGIYLFTYTLLIRSLVENKSKTSINLDLTDSPLRYRYINAKNIYAYPSLAIEIKKRNGMRSVDYLFYNQPF